MSDPCAIMTSARRARKQPHTREAPTTVGAFVMPGGAMTTRADIETAILEYHATVNRLEHERRTEAELIAAIRARRDELLDEWATCPA